MYDDDKNKTEVTSLAELVNTQKVHDVHGQPMMVVQQDFKVVDLEKFLPSPRNIKAQPTFRTVDSLISYVKRYQSDSTVVFADAENNTITAIMDYHTDQDTPDWCFHKAFYECPLSKEWQMWVNSDGRKINQRDFAEFLEARSQDVVEPDGAELLEIALTFKAIRQAVFSSGMRLNTGEFQLQYSEENQKGTIELPETITIGIAPFHNGEKYELKARLRYSLRDGDLNFSYHLIDPHRVVEDAFNEIRSKVDIELAEVDVFEAQAA